MNTSLRHLKTLQTRELDLLNFWTFWTRTWTWLLNIRGSNVDRRTGGLDRLRKFFNFLNELYPSLKSTMLCSKICISFLEVEVSKSKSEKNSKYQPVYETSWRHPPVPASFFMSLISLLQIYILWTNRIKHSCSDDSSTEIVWFRVRLVGTGYRAEVFQPEIQTLSSIDCNVLLAKCLKHEGSVTLILIFHSALHVILACITKSFLKLKI